MHDDASPPDQPRTPAGDQITDSKDDALLAARRFPGAEPAPAAPLPGPPVRAPRSSFGRMLLPAALVIGAIAALAWVSQYMTGSGPTTTPTPAPTGGQPMLDRAGVIFYRPAPGGGPEFTKTKTTEVYAVWDLRYPQYALEFETPESGYYDYLFVNECGQDAEIGLAMLGCTCSQARVCVLPADQVRAHAQAQHKGATWRQVPEAAAEPKYGWQDLAPDSEKKHGLTVPAGQGGLVRLLWKGEKAKTQQHLKIWTRPLDPASDTVVYDLYANMDPVNGPVKFTPEKLEFGDLLEGDASKRDFLCWSGTRSSFQLEFPENKDNPCLQCQATPLSPEACASETARFLLKEKVNTRVLAAYRVTVTLTTKVGEHRLGMGFLYRQVPVKANLGGAPEPIPAPVFYVVVASDVRINGKFGGDLNLGVIKTQTGKTMKFNLFADEGVALEYLGKKGAVSPPGLDAKLKKKETAEGQTHWELTVVVEPGVLTGPLINSYVELQSTRPGGPPQQIRLPVKGKVITNSGF